MADRNKVCDRLQSYGNYFCDRLRSCDRDRRRSQKRPSFLINRYFHVVILITKAVSTVKTSSSIILSF